MTIFPGPGGHAFGGTPPTVFRWFFCNRSRDGLAIANNRLVRILYHRQIRHPRPPTSHHPARPPLVYRLQPAFPAMEKAKKASAKPTGNAGILPVRRASGRLTRTGSVTVERRGAVMAGSFSGAGARRPSTDIDARQGRRGLRARLTWPTAPKWREHLAPAGGRKAYTGRDMIAGYFPATQGRAGRSPHFPRRPSQPTP